MIDREGRLEAEIAELRADRDASVARERILRAACEDVLARLDDGDRWTSVSRRLVAKRLRAALKQEMNDDKRR